jgi:hypothetical protein
MIMPTYFPHQEDDDVPRRRAGQRSDELLPGQSNENPAAEIAAAGTPGGGMAPGGLGGVNDGTGSLDDDPQLEVAMENGLYDNDGDTEDTDEPEAGPSGGAVGGTPAGKRAGRRMHDPR